MENKTLEKAYKSLGISVESKSVQAPDSVYNQADTIRKAVVSVGGTDIDVMVIDRLNKGAILGNISEIVSDFFIEKTGKEIAEKAKAIKTLDDLSASSCMASANEIANGLEKKPTCTDMIGDYELRGVKQKFGKVPMMYSYDDIYPPKTYETQYSLSQVVNSQNDDDVKKMREYNAHIRNYVEYRVESLLLDTVISNIDGKKKYQLTTKQASALGF